jgi:hypothetical protein
MVVWAPGSMSVSPYPVDGHPGVVRDLGYPSLIDCDPERLLEVRPVHNGRPRMLVSRSGAAVLPPHLPSGSAPSWLG